MTPEPFSLRQVLGELVARRGYGREQGSAQLADVWRQVAGNKLADQTRVGSLKRGTLEITVANNLLLQEILFQKQQLLKGLIAQLPPSTISDLRFRIGPVGEADS